MFALLFLIVSQTVLNLALIDLVWAVSEAQINTRGAVALGFTVINALVWTLIRQYFAVKLSSSAKSLLLVNMTAVTLVLGFHLCDWPEPTRYVATVALVLSTGLWWLAGIARLFRTPRAD